MTVSSIGTAIMCKASIRILSLGIHDCNKRVCKKSVSLNDTHIRHRYTHIITRLPIHHLEMDKPTIFKVYFGPFR